MTRKGGHGLKYNQDKVDEMTLALLYLVTTDRKEGFGARAGKGFSWDTLNRLHMRGWIDDPRGKALSLYLTEIGFEKSKQLFLEHFGTEE